MDTKTVNIHPLERSLSALLGVMLLIRSLTHRSLASIAVGSLLLYRGVRGHNYLYQALGRSTVNGSQHHEAGTSESAFEVVRSLTIEKPIYELYRLWREPESFSQIMGDIADVTAVNNDRQHWLLHVPFKKRLEWDTRLVESQPDTLLRWKTLAGAPLPHEGSVSFRPAPKDWGTEVTLCFRFELPAGKSGSRSVKPLNMATPLLAEKVLRRYKSLAETGEISTLKRNPAARPSAYTHA
jgi:uncharacterized membrane protein